MTNSITINLDSNEKAFYYPNETISGTVEVKIGDYIKIRCVEINLEGKEYLKIGLGKYSTVKENKFLDVTTILHGSKKDSFEFPEGVHSYRFSFQLPAQIPCSAEGASGHIRYKLKANLDIPWALDLHNDSAFTVLRHEDLRAFPELGVPYEEQVIHKHGQLKIKARLPKLGYVLGETITLKIEITNNSSKPVNYTAIALKRVDEYVAGLRSFTDKTLIKENLGLEVNANDTVWFASVFTVYPGLMISNDRYSENYKISYEIRILAETEAVELKQYIPISIGIIGFDA